MQATRANDRAAVHTALIGVFTGLVATGITVTGAISSNSVAILADMLATIFEFLAVLLSWLTLRRMNREDKITYNYGQGKMEGLASLSVAVLMFLSLGIIAFNALSRFTHPETISGFGVWLVLAAHMIFGGINSSLFWRSLALARRQKSSLLDSQARLFATKAFSNLCMILSLGFGLFLSQYRWVQYMDPATSVLIAAVMFFGAYQIVRQNIGDLLDKTLEENLQVIILRELAGFFDEYTAFHALRSRKSGRKIYIEVFLEFDGSRRHSEVQQVVDNMKATLEAAIPDSDVSIIPTTRTP